MIAMPRRGTFWRKFVPLFGAGLVGVAGAVPVITPMLQRLVAAPPRGATLPSLPVLLAAQIGQLAVLTGGAVAIGIALAPRLGLRSHIVEAAEGGKRLWAALKPEVPLATAMGAAMGLAIVALDEAFRPWMPAAWLELERTQPRGLAVTIAGVLYGGITEELLMRWSLMTLLAWLLWRALQRGAGQPLTWLMWAAIGVSALLFGVGHLGAAAAIAPLTPMIVVRTVLLNAGAGVVLGWLYWWAVYPIHLVVFGVMARRQARRTHDRLPSSSTSSD
jgi:hypothetical protein